MSLKGCFFSIISSGRHFVQPRGAILVILVRAIGGILLCKYFEVRPLAKDERSFEDFLFSAMAAVMFNGAEPSRPSWIFDRHNFSLFRSRSHPVATEQVSAQSDVRFDMHIPHMGYTYLNL